MWATILQVAMAIGSVATLLTVLYRTYWSPAAKAKRKKEAETQNSIYHGDPGGTI